MLNYRIWNPNIILLALIILLPFIYFGWVIFCLFISPFIKSNQEFYITEE